MTYLPDADRPINRTAARVVSKWTHFIPKIKPDTRLVTDIRPSVWKGTHVKDPGLIGLRFGRFTVIGLSAEKRGRWVCRCDCGNYEVRTAKSIKNPKNAGDRCIVCRKTSFITTGSDF